MDDSLQAWVDAALTESTAAKPDTDYEISISFQPSAQMRDINHEYRNVDAPTNVLSFPSEMPLMPTEQGRSLQALGDIVLCPEVVEHEAQSQGKQSMHHYAHLVIHGILHVVGYDHESDGDATAMESLEIQILSGLEISNPYDATTNEVSSPK